MFHFLRRLFRIRPVFGKRKAELVNNVYPMRKARRPGLVERIRVGGW